MTENPGMTRWLVPVTAAFAVLMAVVHLLQVNLYLWPSDLFNAYHLGFALTLVFLSSLGGAREGLDLPPVTGRAAWLAMVAMLLLTIVASVYIQVEYEALVHLRAYFPNSNDIVVAGILLLVTFVAVRREWGVMIPALVAVVLLYGYFGGMLPEGILYHGGIPFPRLAGLTSIPYFNGLLGSLAGISATTLFVFLLFAGLMKANGGVDFIVELANRMFGRTRAGPAQVAVFGSGMMAMISGSSVANIASTGAVTIPAMKGHGYGPSFAGAVEAVASNGGQIMPPVMGLAAFIMIGMTGHSYAEIAFAALFPGLIYYVYLMVAVQLYAVSHDLRPGQEGSGTPVGTLVLHNLGTIVGVVVLLSALVMRLPAETCVSLAIMTLVLLEILKQLAVNRRRPVRALAEFVCVVLSGLETGARNGAKIAVIMCLIGVLVEVFIVTGLGQKLANHVAGMSDGGLIMILPLVAISCIVLGCGLPTTAAYVMVVLMSAPILVEVGVPLLAAHLFVFYFANMSAITPPVAIGALVAANIARAPFLRTAFASMRLALPGFVMPFLFVLNPAIIGIDASPFEQIATSLSALLALVLLTFVIQGFLLRRLNLAERLALAAAAAMMLHSAWWTTGVGVLTLGLVAIVQFYSREPRTSAR